MLRYLKEMVRCSAYLCFPSRRFSRCVLATRLQVRHDCAAVRDSRSVGGTDRVETPHTGRSRSGRVRAAAVVFVAAVAAVAATVSREDRQGKRVRSAPGGLDYEPDGDLAGA